jgi:hypothetical protein
MSVNPIKSIEVGDFSLLLFKDGEREYSELWNCGDCEFVLNFHATKNQIKEIIRIFRLGIEQGKKSGRNELTYEFRKLFNLPDNDNLSERIGRLEDRD